MHIFYEAVNNRKKQKGVKSLRETVVYLKCNRDVEIQSADVFLKEFVPAFETALDESIN